MWPLKRIWSIDCLDTFWFIDSFCRKICQPNYFVEMNNQQTSPRVNSVAKRGLLLAHKRNRMARFDCNTHTNLNQCGLRNKKGCEKCLVGSSVLCHWVVGSILGEFEPDCVGTVAGANRGRVAGGYAEGKGRENAKTVSQPVAACPWEKPR